MGNIKVITGSAIANESSVDKNGNLSIEAGLPAHPSAGGWYSVAGGTSSVVAASLAQDTLLMSAKFNPSSTRFAYITKIRIVFSPATVGIPGTVPGTLGLLRFVGTTPTGGTARTPNEINELLTTPSDMTDIRDNNAALTGSPSFGAVVSNNLVPIMNSGTNFEWIFEPAYPLVLHSGDGIALRTTVAMPATQTWMYSYDMHWYEA